MFGSLTYFRLFNSAIWCSMCTGRLVLYVKALVGY